MDDLCCCIHHDVHTQIENVRKGPPLPLDRFLEGFEGFCKTAGVALEGLQKQAEAAEARFAELATFLGEDPAKCTPEELFGLFVQFASEFGRVGACMCLGGGGEVSRG